MLHRRRRRHETDEAADTGRPQRGWGPFSGGQLTAIVLGITAAIAFPIGASAVTGTTVFVTDQTSGAKATVDATGHLAVTASPTPPSSSYNTTWQYVFSNDSCTAITAPVPKDTALIVQAITVNINGTSNPGPVLVSTYGAKPGTPCIPLGNAVDISSVAGQGSSTVIEFPQGLPIKRGHVVGLFAGSLTGDVVATAEVKGYLVPAGQCTKVAPPVGCW